mmetsp:Transcript_17994/g.51602  ORF Transcript_17994/g.51602 Transcript_17994/m.51602 type:complete len:346 (+) Transcript_17994:1399-2436(+)
MVALQHHHQRVEQNDDHDEDLKALRFDEVPQFEPNWVGWRRYPLDRLLLHGLLHGFNPNALLWGEEPTSLLAALDLVKVVDDHTDKHIDHEKRANQGNQNEPPRYACVLAVRPAEHGLAGARHVHCGVHDIWPHLSSYHFEHDEEGLANIVKVERVELAAIWAPNTRESAPVQAGLAAAGAVPQTDVDEHIGGKDTAIVAGRKPRPHAFFFACAQRHVDVVARVEPAFEVLHADNSEYEHEEHDHDRDIRDGRDCCDDGVHHQSHSRAAADDAKGAESAKRSKRLECFDGGGPGQTERNERDADDDEVEDVPPPAQKGVRVEDNSQREHLAEHFTQKQDGENQVC